MRTILLSLILIIAFTSAYSQFTPLGKGVILAVEDDKVYLDLNENNISVGDRLQVIQDRGFFTHPVTGEQIAREPEIVAYIQITEVMSNYSVGSVSPRNAISNLSVGMEAFLLEGEQRETREFRKSIAVQPMNVSSARGGYLGFYMADLLTEELFNIDKFMVIDRQTLGLQMDEIAMVSQGIIDEKEAIQLGRTRGVDYFITGTVYEPDVIETGTGVPIKGIMQAAEAISGQRLGSEFASDVRVSQLRAIVNITLRVVDVQTGEILFIASEMQEAQGRSQINLEQGALGGLQLQGGATSFLNTITGQATKAALVNLAGYINDYFDGNIDVRNFRGNIIEIGKVGTRSERIDEQNASNENYFSIAPGYGNSYGGLGLRLQYVIPGKVKVGIHGGAGYYPFLNGQVLFSGGVQIYFWDFMYVDTQFGAFGLYSSETYGGYDYFRLYGPSLLLGFDLFVTDHFGFNFASGISVDYSSGGGFWAIDGGFVFRF